MHPLLDELLSVPGIAGYEDRVRSLIAQRLPDGVARNTDNMGNLVATIGAGENAMMFVAHMDEIGFVVTEVRDDGFVKLKAMGGVDPRTAFGQALRVVTETGEVGGVVCVKPPHLMADRAKEMGEVPAVVDFTVDIGASSAEEAAALGVKVLDFCVLHRTPRVLNGKFLCCRALDDRLGCFILLRALDELKGAALKWQVHFAFSVQEEVGLRGAQLLARKHDLEMAFAVDSSSAADFPGVGRDRSCARLGAGTCLRVLDNASVIPSAFRKELKGLAADAGIPLQEIFSGGGTDARAFQPEGPQVMSLAFPLRYTHSAVELAHSDDVDDTIRLVRAIVRKYAS